MIAEIEEITVETSKSEEICQIETDQKEDTHARETIQEKTKMTTIVKKKR